MLNIDPLSNPTLLTHISSKARKKKLPRFGIVVKLPAINIRSSKILPNWTKQERVEFMTTCGITNVQEGTR